MMQSDYFHVGIVVSDFDQSLLSLASTMNVSWSSEIRTTIRMWTRDQGIRRFHVRAVYSVQFPHLEIIQDTPDSLMQYVDGRPLHHLGYWTNNLRAESDAMEQAGHPRVMHAVDNDDEMYGCVYHELPNGLLLELVGRDQFPDWHGFLTGTVAFGTGIERGVGTPDR